MRLAKVISGGQTGADQAGLQAATACDIATGGWAPRGWKTETGPAPWLAEFGLLQHESLNYDGRTNRNIKESDATVLFGHITSPGSRLTSYLAQVHDKHILHFDVPFIHRARVLYMVSWLETEKVRVLNVAGNRESVNPGIEVAVTEFLLEVFSKLCA